MTPLAGNKIYLRGHVNMAVSGDPVHSFLGECAWTGRVDNTFGQPATKA